MNESLLNGQHFDSLIDSEITNELTTNILNEINAFIFVFDVQNLKPLWINSYFTKRMGFTNDDIKNPRFHGWVENFLNRF